MSGTDLLFIACAVVVIYLLFRRRDQKPVAGTEIGQLNGPGSYLFDIVGESKYQGALEQICGGRTEDGAEKYVRACLNLEDANPFDDQAVRVDIDGRTVGYLSRTSARHYRKRLTELGHLRIVCECDAIIVGGWDRGDGDKGHFGVRLDLPVD